MRVRCTQIGAVASDMEQPLKSVMLVTTAHILASDLVRDAGQPFAAEPLQAYAAEFGAGSGGSTFPHPLRVFWRMSASLSGASDVQILLVLLLTLEASELAAYIHSRLSHVEERMLGITTI